MSVRNPFEVASLRDDLVELLRFGPRSTDDVEARSQTLALLRERLTEAGYRPLEVVFDEPAGRRNLLAERSGTDAQAPVLEIAAHFDTVEHTPGADDNGSGVIAVLAAARYFSRLQSRRTVRFCFFDCEETGLRGSQAHQQWLDSDPRTLAGSIVFEMIGFRRHEPNSQRTPLRIPFIFWPPRVADFVAVVTNADSRKLADSYEKSAQAGTRPLNTYRVPSFGGLLKDALRSDHSSYWDAGRSAIMLTDTANFRNPNYHAPSDTLETLDFEFLSSIAQAATRMAHTWADAG